MSRLLLVYRLVAGDIRRRPVQSAMLVVVIVTTTTTLTLGLTLRHVAQNPFARTRAATNGPDVVVHGQPNPGSPLQLTHTGEQQGLRTPSQAFTRLGHAAGVAAIGGPFPLAFVRLTAPGVDVAVNAEGRTYAPSAVNQPLVTAGRWVRPGGVVLEQGLAGVLDLRVGDHIRLRDRSFTVVGVALQTEQPFYPAGRPGLVWVTPADARRLATRSDPLGYSLGIKLTHPSAADGFWNTAAFNAFGTALIGSSVGRPWQANRDDDYRVVTIDQTALLVAAWLLALLAIATIAVLVGGRMTEQTRRLGLLKAAASRRRL